jgi:hypothetical protein
VQPFDGLRLALVAEGYTLIHFFQFSCGAHGCWRAGIESEECKTYRCPVCKKRCRTVFLAPGYTRREMPQVEMIAKPLMRVRKTQLQAEGQEIYFPAPYHLSL